ncbi:hypothetical protein ACF0H5_023727 [Mactra antiquata]
MALGTYPKIAIGWAAVWISGGMTFWLLQKRIEQQRKTNLRLRKQHRRQQRQKQKELEAQNELRSVSTHSLP